MHGVHTKQVIAYAALPGIMPRLRAFFGSGFGYVAFLMAYVYNIVRLIPNGHPYLNPKNIGKYGIRHVIAQAANNLVLSRKNIDQIIIFFILFAGIVILAAQFALIILGLLLPSAFAQSMFITPENTSADTTLDIAFILLDKVFGVPNFFCAGNNNAECTGVLAGGRTPFHVAFHEMLRFYSHGMLIIGVLIFLYFVVVVVGETATSGTPFGQRFQNVWVPIRLVVALGLLVPINYGLNTGQYIALFAAKTGSSLATNGWSIFNRSIAESADGSIFSGMDDPAMNPTGERDTLLALPAPPDVSGLVQFMSAVHGCTYGDWRTYSDSSNAWNGNQAILNTPADIPAFYNLDVPYNEVYPDYKAGPVDGFRIRPYLVKNPLPWSDNQQNVVEIAKQSYAYPRGVTSPGKIENYVEALDFYNNSDITIVFGEYNPDVYKNFMGGVKPTCGSIRISIGDLQYRGEGDEYGGADYIQNFYFKMIMSMWDDSFNLPADGGDIDAVTIADKIKALSYRIIEKQLNTKNDLSCNIGCGVAADMSLPTCPDDCREQEVGVKAKDKLVMEAQGQIQGAIFYAWDQYRQRGLDFDLIGIMDRGWAGAGIWYNNIAKISGGFINAVVATPQVVAMPYVMEKVLETKRAQDNDFGLFNMFNPNFENPTAKLPDVDHAQAQALNAVHQYWVTGSPQQLNKDRLITNNFFIDTVYAIFGLEGLMSIRGDNVHIHPMAQLSSVGKSLVDSAVRSVGGSIVTGFAGGLFSGEAIGKVAQIASSFLSSTAFLGLTAGIVLYYVIPFLPFIYFYFAVAQWVKGLFEAMVGVPLWALAHLRIDGNGLPGESASFGYFLIFEIFVRPIMIVFGLIAAMVIFTAQVRILNFIWLLVVDNLSGFNGSGGAYDFIPDEPGVDPEIAGKAFARAAVDQFFFTIIYTIIVYMLATASFKLIDKVPDNILRWFGAGVSAFGDINTDPTEGVTRYAGMAGTVFAPQITRATQQAAQGTGGALRGLVNAANAATKGNQTPDPGGGGAA